MTGPVVVSGFVAYPFNTAVAAGTFEKQRAPQRRR